MDGASACPRCRTQLHEECAKLLDACPPLGCAGRTRRTVTLRPVWALLVGSIVLVLSFSCAFGGIILMASLLQKGDDEARRRSGTRDRTRPTALLEGERPLSSREHARERGWRSAVPGGVCRSRRGADDLEKEGKAGPRNRRVCRVRRSARPREQDSYGGYGGNDESLETSITQLLHMCRRATGPRVTH